MPFKPGQSGNPKGRERGLTRAEALRRKAEKVTPPRGKSKSAQDWKGMSPLAILSEIAHNKKLTESLRAKAASDAAPYIHSRQPQAIHVTESVRLEKITVVVLGGPRAMTPATPEPKETP